MANPTLRGARRMAPWQRAIVAALIVSLAAFASTTFTALAAATIVTSLSTNTSGPTAGGTSVTVNGSGFMTGGTGSTAATAVTFGGTAATFTVTDDTHIAATAPAHAAGAVPVVVTNVDGASNATVMYTYVAPVPAVTLVSPTHGAMAGGDTVTITGTGLSFATAVHFGTAAGAIVTNTDTSITVTSPSHTAGQVDIDVTTAGGTSTHTAADLFTFDALPAPTVTSVVPNSGPTAGGTAVTITGTGFTGASAVTFTGSPATFTVTDDTHIAATSPAHAAGVTDVQVTANSLVSAVNANDKFTYGSGPTITSVAPAIGGIAGGTTVTITGTALTGATAVTFGGISATYTVASDTSIVATAPPHAAGTVDVAVTTPLGNTANTAADNFVYTAVPIVTSINPTSGPTGGGTVVTVTGQNLTGATSVTFGGVAGTALSNVTATSLTVTSPSAAAAGTVDVLVTSPAGTSANTTADNFTYGALPVITALNPTSGPAAGGTTVTVTGTGLTGATAVNVDGTAITPSNVTATSLTFVTPAHAAGVVNISVTTPLGTSADTAADNFTFGASTITYTLYFRFSLIVWQGVDGVNIDTVLKGLESPDNPATNDISGAVTAIYRYNNPAQKFEGWFPNSASIPGANDFNVLNNGTAYWIAESTNPSITWTVVAG